MRATGGTPTRHGLGALILAAMTVGGWAAGEALPAPAPQDCSRVVSHELLGAVLWMQRAAEYRAATRQAFNAAQRNLERALREPGWPEAVAPPDPTACRPQLAVIVDVDETILDNSPTAAAQIAAGRRTFDREAWKRWEARGEARPLDGALEFLAFAEEHGVTVFYVTNRRNEEGVRRNLAALGVGLPDKPDVVLVRGECDDSSDKSCRRNAVARDYRVVLLVGDDLNDFLPADGLSLAKRAEAVREAAARWGREWIILPNPAYGSWERALVPDGADDCTVLRAKLVALDGP